ncbi:MAG TPA: hypothetical protein VKK79_19140, partial [Candidatus Lokiarchaeia archaeon]|nr:hypothetical protein [Candidatus Lokiarchaeia archaeon]
MAGDLLEAKFRFLRDDAFLVAQVNAQTGVQQLVMQQVDPATGQVVFEDAITCIHTAVADIPRDEFEETISDPEFAKDVLRIRSSENLEEINLTPADKFSAFRSWVAGIAEAGLGAFELQSEIEAEGKLMYPIASRLMGFIAKVEPRFLEEHLNRIVAECQFESASHEASLIANLEPLVRYAGDYGDQHFFDVIMQLPLPARICRELFDMFPSGEDESSGVRGAFAKCER